MPTIEQQALRREKEFIPIACKGLRESLAFHQGMREQHNKQAAEYLANLQRHLARANELGMKTDEIWGDEKKGKW